MEAFGRSLGTERPSNIRAPREPSDRSFSGLLERPSREGREVEEPAETREAPERPVADADRPDAREPRGEDTRTDEVAQRGPENEGQPGDGSGEDASAESARPTSGRRSAANAAGETPVAPVDERAATQAIQLPLAALRSIDTAAPLVASSGTAGGTAAEARLAPANTARPSGPATDGAPSTLPTTEPFDLEGTAKALAAFEEPAQAQATSQNAVASTATAEAGAGAAPATRELGSVSSQPSPAAQAAHDAPRTPEDVERAGAILQQVRVALSPNMREAVIDLRPPELGRISIRLSIEDGRASAVVRAESPEALDVLARHLPELRAALEQQGLRADDFDLGLGFQDRSGQGAAGRGDGRDASRAGLDKGGDGTDDDAPSASRGLRDALTRTLAGSAGVDFYA